MKRLKPVAALLLLAIALFATYAPADEIVPSGSKPLSELVKAVEDKKVGLVKKAELDDGLWEIKAINPYGDVAIFYMDPRTGSVIKEKTDTERHADKPTSDDKPLSEILAMIEKNEKTPVSEIEFDDGIWKVVLRNETDKTQFHLDPKTGQKLVMK